MAIVKMQKLSLCAAKSHRKEILETLQSLGVIDIDNTSIQDEELAQMDTRTAIQTFEKNAQVLDNVLGILKTHAGVSSGGGLFSEPEIVSKEKFDGIVKHQNRFMRHAAAIEEAEKGISECKGIIKKDENQIIALGPWSSLDIPLGYHGTSKVRTLIGQMPGTWSADALYQTAIEGLSAEDGSDDSSKGEASSFPVDCQIISCENSVSNVVVMCLRKDRDQVRQNLRAAGFAAPPGDEKGIPSERIEFYQADIKKQQGEIEKLEEKIRSFTDEADEFRIAADYYRTRAEKYRVLATIPQSENMFFLEGWVPAEKAEPLKRLLEDRYDAFIEFEESREDELEPTLLSNNRFSSSAEGVLEAYGLPTKGRIDPTTVMSFFYVFFFGMMLSDAGYGLVMAIGCAVLLLKKPRMGDGMKKMLRLFFWCGLSTTVWGFLYGGFFGDAIDVVAKTFFGFTGDTLLKPLWFAPLNDPMRLLIWCMLFGLIHLFAGLAIKGAEYLQQGDVVGFFSDVVAWYLMLIGLVLMLMPSDIFASISGQTYHFPAWLVSLSKIMAAVGALTILVMSGRTNKNWGVRIALGAYDLYGITSWLSDLLSYSRLLALGLATGVIANVINMMASYGGGGVVGAIIFIVVFIFGHLLNLAINALGAYVHTNRLQYVEFFSKFYDAGGKKYNPFKPVSKYVQIKEEK
ncbi:MAG: V-type ATP synthase subunit I [Firmicutes bacterium]|nr:V-type ATP synthase subunit I [Bacillota bacterium]